MMRYYSLAKEKVIVGPRSVSANSCQAFTHLLTTLVLQSESYFLLRVYEKHENIFFYLKFSLQST